MNNLKNRTNSQLHNFETGELVAPTINITLNDEGLLPVHELEKPVAVTFPLGPNAFQGTAYQLLWNGSGTGPVKFVQAGDNPGDIMNLEIPVSALSAGRHRVAYQLTNPENGVKVNSPSAPVHVDRRPPGSPQLGPIIFPPTVQDGLTSSELESMNNVLVGQIAGYTGMREFDLVQTYWNSVAGPTVVVDKDDMGLKRVNVGFSRRYLEAIGDIEAPVHYTVTDLAGNVSIVSDPVIVKLQLSVLPVLPVPSVKEANGNTLDPANATRGATVLIGASAELKLNDRVLVQWEGPKGSDTKEKVIAGTDVGKELALVFAAALVTVNDGETVSISYVVSRSNGAEQQSDPFLLQILGGLRQLPPPSMDTVGADGIVTPGNIPESGATVRVAYQDMQPTDSVIASWKGVSAHDTPPQVVGSAAQLQFNLPKALITAAAGHPATVSYAATRASSTVVSSPLQLTVSPLLEFDASPVTLPGKIYLLPSAPDLLPAFPDGTTLQRVASGGQAPYVYSSSDPLVAVVDETGLTSVRGRGEAIISVTDALGITASYTVTVTGVIHCVGLGNGTSNPIFIAAANAGARIPSIEELREIFNAYGSRWPMGNNTYWSSSITSQSLLGTWYWVKNLVLGQEVQTKHSQYSNGVGLR
ncbi:MAG TPA: hypothetical protein VF671_02135 [Pseudomonas sp.]|jgi:hypothetical protein|uniref:hypothetical protein n=1 Tax=Pseudomonas sp. TaxID=306 RepID=UPI002ED7BA04